MNDREEVDRSLRQYLLGALAEEERARIEADALHDDGRFEELLALEDELFHDYARGGLSDVERGQFEARFLSTPEGRDRMDAARALMDRLGPADARRPGAAPASLRWLAAAAALLVAAGTAWLGWRASQARVREAGLPTAPPSIRPSAGPPVTPSAAPVRVIALALSPGLLRSGGAAPRVVLPATGEATLRLTLTLPPASRHQRYAASLQSPDGLTVWSGAAAPDGRTVTVDVPVRAVPENDYEVVLRALTATGSQEVASYPLRVLLE
jgi:hypothetical protein